MCSQNIKTAFIGAAILLFFTKVQAQIEKGTTTLGGSLNFNAAKGWNTLSGTPSYGRFITDKILLKGSLDVNTSNNTNLGNRDANFDIAPEVRYYFNPKSQWQLFGGASLGLRRLTISSDMNSIKFTNHDFHKSAYIGVNKFLNKDITVEGTLGVKHSNIMLNPQLATNSIYGLTNVYTTGLNFSINNFTHFKSSESDFEGLINKGRTVIGGNLSINHYSGRGVDVNANFSSIKRRGNYATLSAEYGLFIAKGLLIGTKTNIVLSDNAKIYGITPYAQYFYPVSKRLMLHAKAEVDYNVSKTSSWGTLKGGVGVTYFLSKNVALNVDVLNFNKNFSSQSTFNNRFGSSNIGLRFFLK